MIWGQVRLEHMQELEILMPWTWICVLLAGYFIERGGGLQVDIRAIIGVGSLGNGLR